jgi:hypothetical protein
MVGSAAQIDRILLYAYLNTSSQPILMPPFKAKATICSRASSTCTPARWNAS